MWISFNGLQEGTFSGVSFPYVAQSPSNRKKAEFKDISDIYDEIIRLYGEAKDKGFNVGESIYTQSFFFADLSLLIDNKLQNRIREYQYCKQFNCPPFPSMQETPAKIVEQFSVIEQEFNFCIKKQQEEKSNA